MSTIVALVLATGRIAAAEPPQDDGASQGEVFPNAVLGEPDEAIPTAGPILEWSKQPGVYESELHRRFENPLYVPSRQKVSEEDLLAAKRRDAEREWDALDHYIGLANDKERMARYERASEMGDALLRIDEGTWEALRAGGEAYALAGAIQKLRLWLLSQWRDVAGADAGVKALLDAEGRIPSVETDSPAIRFLALIQAGGNDDNGPLRRYEFGAALISEEPDAIRKVYQSLRGELKDTVSEQLTQVLEDIGRDDIEFAERDQKVTLVADLLGRTPTDFGIRLQPAPASN